MERDAAADVKQKQPILVILGNPPYNGFAGVSPEEEARPCRGLQGWPAQEWGITQGQGLNDLYVRFFRMAERRIAEMRAAAGIVCFISNYSWLDGPSFVADARAPSGEVSTDVLDRLPERRQYERPAS